MLTVFAEETVEEEYRPYIYRQISDCINWCIRLMNTLGKEDRDRLYSEIYRNRAIFDSYMKSSALTHRIEGVLMKAFPRRMQVIYNTLDRMRR